MNNCIDITTNKETAIALEKHCNWEAINGSNKSYKLKEIRHEENYSVILLEPSFEHKTIDPADIFFLGYYSCLNT